MTSPEKGTMDIEIIPSPPERPASERITEVTPQAPKPHPAAARSTEKDLAVLTWALLDPEDFAERVLARLEGYPDPDECWTQRGRSLAVYGTVSLPRWLGVLDADGDGAQVQTHRAIWIASGREIPYGLVLDHDDPDVGCGIRACANPAHLAVSTDRDNIVVTGGGVSADCAVRTTCPAGHPLDGPDADFVPSHAARGWRNCRRCAIAANAVQNALLSAAMDATGLAQRDLRAKHGESLAALTALIPDAVGELAARVDYEYLRIVSHLDGRLAELANDAVERLFSEWE